MPRIPRPELRQKAIAFCARGLTPGEAAARLQELFGTTHTPSVISGFARRAGVAVRTARGRKPK